MRKVFASAFISAFFLAPSDLSHAGEWKSTRIVEAVAAPFSQTTYKLSDDGIEAASIVFKDGKPISNPQARGTLNGWTGYSRTIKLFETGLPDGGEAWLEEVMLPTRAWYTKPTKRYPHGALGDDIEAAELTVQLGQLEFGRFVHKLPENQVFEDRMPRVVDLDGYGKASVITILSDVEKGASVALFGSTEQDGPRGKLHLAAQTPYIGTPNRWLNIAGIEDFDGSGSQSIALVETPHIGGTLQFWRWSWPFQRKTGAPPPKATLTKIAEAPGFSNHKFGSREQRLSAVEDFDNDGVSDLALPSADRKTLKLVKLSGFENPQIQEIASIPLPSPIDKAIGVSRNDDDVVITVGLEDGSVYAIHQ